MTKSAVDAHNAKILAGRLKNAVPANALPPPASDDATPCTDRPKSVATPQIASQSEVSIESWLKIYISGQIRGGKNNMIVTRSGLHFPKKEWAKWRDAAVDRVKFQLPRDFKTISEPVNVRVTYVAGDRRRRDCPAILDAVWHVLEKAGVVADDTLLWPVESSRSYEKDSPRCEIEILNL